jgi:hypothetical protein
MVVEPEETQRTEIARCAWYSPTGKSFQREPQAASKLTRLRRTRYRCGRMNAWGLD